MAQNLITCQYCKEKLVKNEAKKRGTRSYYHEECLTKKEEQEKQKKKEADDYKELIEYICTLYGIEAPTGMILKQIKEYKENLDFKYSGMLLSLKYFFEMNDGAVIEDAGVGIIPYIYEDAKKHYIMKKEVEKSLNDYVLITDKVIEVESPKFVFDTVKKNSFIDISSL